MLDTIRKLVGLLTAQERRRAMWLACAMVIMALLEVAGIFSIMPFMALMANPHALQSQPILTRLYQFFGAQTPDTFLFTAGLVTISMMALSNLFASITTWQILRFVYRQEDDFSQRLLRAYLHKPYSFFLSRNSAELTKDVFAEVTAVVHGMLIPGMQALARAIISVFIFILLLVVDAALAVTVALVLGGAYGLIYGIARTPLSAAGRRHLASNKERFKAASEAMGGIKEIKLYGREDSFWRRYSSASERVASFATTQHLITQLPRYALEVIAFGGIIALVLFLIATRRNLENVLPLLTLYALAGYRLMPALQQIFAATSSIRFYSGSLNTLFLGLASSAKLPALDAIAPTRRVPMRGQLILEDICFSHSGTEHALFTNLRLSIRENSSVAFVGATGSGKTTLVDLIMGLHAPDGGRMMCGATSLTPDNIKQWQCNFGYVPQDIYLVDDTLTRNIAFGLPDAEIDEARVRSAARAAHIDGFIDSSLPDGYRTVVGERGVRLSGGQKQRVGIARALYQDPNILVFDEATSALDNATEQAVMEAIRELSGKKTLLLIAHRISSVQACDVIHVLDHGKIIASGTYAELIENCDYFRSLALLNGDTG